MVHRLCQNDESAAALRMESQGQSVCDSARGHVCELDSRAEESQGRAVLRSVVSEAHRLVHTKLLHRVANRKGHQSPSESGGRQVPSPAPSPQLSSDLLVEEESQVNMRACLRRVRSEKNRKVLRPTCEECLGAEREEGTDLQLLREEEGQNVCDFQVCCPEVVGVEECLNRDHPKAQLRSSRHSSIKMEEAGISETAEQV